MAALALHFPIFVVLLSGCLAARSGSSGHKLLRALEQKKPLDYARCLTPDVEFVDRPTYLEHHTDPAEYQASFLELQTRIQAHSTAKYLAWGGHSTAFQQHALQGGFFFRTQNGNEFIVSRRHDAFSALRNNPIPKFSFEQLNKNTAEERIADSQLGAIDFKPPEENGMVAEPEVPIPGTPKPVTKQRKAAILAPLVDLLCRDVGCVHGDCEAGECICEGDWSGPKCNVEDTDKQMAKEVGELKDGPTSMEAFRNALGNDKTTNEEATQEKMVSTAQLMAEDAAKVQQDEGKKLEAEMDGDLGKVEEIEKDEEAVKEDLAKETALKESGVEGSTDAPERPIPPEYEGKSCCKKTKWFKKDKIKLFGAKCKKGYKPISMWFCIPGASSFTNNPNDPTTTTIVEETVSDDSKTAREEDGVDVTTVMRCMGDKAMSKGCRCDAIGGRCIPKTDTKSCACSATGYNMCQDNEICCRNGPLGNKVENVVDEFQKWQKLRGGINKGLSMVTIPQAVQYIGDPGDTCLSKQCTVDKPCSCDGNFAGDAMKTLYLDNGITLNGNPIIVDRLARVFARIKKADEILFNSLSSAGSFCCRGVRQASGELTQTLSPHSFGSAIDLYCGCPESKEGAQKWVQQCILAVAPMFEREKFFWQAGETGDHDAMHFEASGELLAEVDNELEAWRIRYNIPPVVNNA